MQTVSVKINGKSIDFQVLKLEVLFNKKPYVFYVDSEGEYLFVGEDLTLISSVGGFKKLSKVKPVIKRYLLHECPDTTIMDKVHPEFDYKLISLEFK